MTICPQPSFKRDDNSCFNSCAKTDGSTINTRKSAFCQVEKEKLTKYKKDTKNPVLLKYGVFQALY